jgi:hypothetical protein
MNISEITREFNLLGRDFRTEVNDGTTIILESDLPFYMELTIQPMEINVRYDIMGWDSEQDFARTTDDLGQIYLQALTLYEEDVKEALAEAKQIEKTLTEVQQARLNKVLENVKGDQVMLNGVKWSAERGWAKNYVFIGLNFRFIYFIKTGVFTDGYFENEFKELDLEKAAKFYQDLYEKS